VPCPSPLILVQLGERFGRLPWEIEDAPTDRAMYYIKVMGVQGEARAEMAGLEPDEEFFREE
jgi:hypothetical protein